MPSQGYYSASGGEKIVDIQNDSSFIMTEIAFQLSPGAETKTFLNAMVHIAHNFKQTVMKGKPYESFRLAG
jgi:hypothetical protein